VLTIGFAANVGLSQIAQPVDDLLVRALSHVRGRNRIHKEAYFQQHAERQMTHQALSADSRMILPVRRLVEIAFENKKWNEVVQLTNALIRVHSSDVSVAYLYNAAANFNLGDLTAAELSARVSNP
jgi:hypothetical protein